METKLSDLGLLKKLSDPELLKKLSDLDLLKGMAQKNLYPDAAKRAWKEFWNRHFPFLLKVCRWRRLGLDEEDHHDLASETILRAYVYAASYKSDKSVTSGNLKAWLCTILHRVFLDSMGVRKTEPLVEDLDRFRSRERRVYRESAWTRAIGEAFKELPTLSRDALRLVFLCYDPDQQPTRLKKGALERIAGTLGISKAYLRTVLYRAKSHILLRTLEIHDEMECDRTTEASDEQ